jgi:hypothetical protein
MYLELVTTVTAVQNDLANAYAASGRMEEIGRYFLVVNKTTIEFFKYVEPPDAMQDLHEAFVNWQECGAAALEEELDKGELIDDEISQRHVEASQAFAELLGKLTAPPEEEEG